MNTLTSIDLSILNFIQEYLTSDFLDKIFVTFTNMGNAGLIWIFFTLIFLTTKEYKNMAKVLIIAMLINFLIVNLLVKPLVVRIRPFELVDGIKLLIQKPQDPSFPSGHTAISFCFLMVVLFFSKSKLLNYMTLIIAILISYSRLYLYVHYPSDVLFGAIFGAAIGILSLKLYSKGYLKKIFKLEKL